MTNLEGNKKWTQDEIINNTRNVVRGLETLKNEHSGLLNNLKSSHEKHGGETELEIEKGSIIQESIEKIELGLGEAQVWVLVCLYGCKGLNMVCILVRKIVKDIENIPRHVYVNTFSNASHCKIVPN